MLAERVKEWTTTWKQQGIEEGIQEGIQKGRLEGRLEGKLEGRLEGRLEGEAELLLRQMNRRFGAIDEATHNRIKTADADTLLIWGERILFAQSIEEVFRD